MILGNGDQMNNCSLKLDQLLAHYYGANYALVLISLQISALVILPSVDVEMEYTTSATTMLIINFRGEKVKEHELCL